MATKRLSAEERFNEAFIRDVIDAVKTNTAPWQQSWQSADINAPYNATSKNFYSGRNAVQLDLVAKKRGYQDPRWATYRQISELGGAVNKGEKGTGILWYGEKTIKDEHGNEKTIGMAKHYHVFNIEQTNLPALTQAQNRDRTPDLEVFANIIEAHNPKILQGEPAYRLSNDTIYLPPKESFVNDAEYYATALHEMSHWTGHPERLNRNLLNKFGSEDYAKEELVAELSSYMLTLEHGLPFTPNQHEAYLQHWAGKTGAELEAAMLQGFQDATTAKNFINGPVYELIRDKEEQKEQTDSTADVVKPSIERTFLTQKEKDQIADKYYDEVGRYIGLSKEESEKILNAIDLDNLNNFQKKAINSIEKTDSINESDKNELKNKLLVDLHSPESTLFRNVQYFIFLDSRLLGENAYETAYFKSDAVANEVMEFYDLDNDELRHNLHIEFFGYVKDELKKDLNLSEADWQKAIKETEISNNMKVAENGVDAVIIPTNEIEAKESIKNSTIFTAIEGLYDADQAEKVSALVKSVLHAENDKEYIRLAELADRAVTDKTDLLTHNQRVPSKDAIETELQTPHTFGTNVVDGASNEKLQGVQKVLNELHQTYQAKNSPLAENTAIVLQQVERELSGRYEHKAHEQDEKLVTTNSDRESQDSDTKQHIATEKTYIDVPFAEKNEAKQLGAKWDVEAKSWYAPEGVDLKPLERWLSSPIQEISDSKPTEPTAKIVGITLISAEQSEVKNKHFSDLNDLQKWMKETYPEESLIEDTGYNKCWVAFTIETDGQRNIINDRIDVSVTQGDFNPHNSRIEEYLKPMLDHYGIHEDIQQQRITAEPAKAAPSEPTKPHGDKAFWQTFYSEINEKERIERIASTRSTYLAVPFDERKEAKQLGAKWDDGAKSWYAPANADLTKLQNWLPEKRTGTVGKTLDDFASSAALIGLDMSQFNPDTDKWHRVPLEGKSSSNKDGAYKLFNNPDGSIGAIARNLSTGEEIKWSDKKPHQEQATEVDIAQRLNREIYTEIRQQARDEIALQRSVEALGLYNKLPDVQGDEPYIVTKGMRNIGGLKRLENGSVVVPLINGERVGGMINERIEITSLQVIAPDGDKRLMKQGSKAGSYFPIGSHEARQNPSHVFIAEGLATAESVAQIMRPIHGEKILVVAAIDSGNLSHVAEKMQIMYPKAGKTIAADNDIATEQKTGTNPGIKAAEAVKEKYPNIDIVAPIPTRDKNTDWNDALQRDGIKQCIADVLTRQDTRQDKRNIAEPITIQTEGKCPREIGKAVYNAIDGNLNRLHEAKVVLKAHGYEIDERRLQGVQNHPVAIKEAFAKAVTKSQTNTQNLDRGMNNVQR